MSSDATSDLDENGWPEHDLIWQQGHRLGHAVAGLVRRGHRIDLRGGDRSWPLGCAGEGSSTSWDVDLLSAHTVSMAVSSAPQPPRCQPCRR